MRPLVIVSDVHLGHRRCDDVADDLARLVASHPDHEIILNGDTFNLSCDPWSADPAVSAPAMIAAHPELRAALEGHLAAGGDLTFVAGNHDMALQRPAVRVALASLLGRDAGRSSDAGSGPGGAEARLSVEPWMLRRGAIHIEHGHLYDPGNSPTHPLAEPSPRAEPVGMELTRHFVGPYDLWEVLADRWTNSAAQNLGVMYDKLGWGVVTSSLYYCGLLGLVNLETAVPARLNRDRRAGEAALPALATINVLSGALRGAGDTRWPWVIVLFGYLVVRIPLTYMLTNPVSSGGYGWGLYGAWIAMFVDLSVRGSLMAARFLHGGWRRARV